MRKSGIEQHQLVYVVDDDIAIRRSMHFLLWTANFTSWPFACAFDFLDNLPNLRPAPILLDIQIPEIDGIDLLSVPPIVRLSGRSLLSQGTPVNNSAPWHF